MSITKFLHEQSDEHSGKLFWPGHNGVPVRGVSAPLLTREEIDASLEEVHDFHEREFDLTVTEDHAAYLQIMDRIISTWYTLIFIERWRHPETNHRMVRLEWTQKYNELSPQAKASHYSCITKVG